MHAKAESRTATVLVYLATLTVVACGGAQDDLASTPITATTEVEPMDRAADVVELSADVPAEESGADEDLGVEADDLAAAPPAPASPAPSKRPAAHRSASRPMAAPPVPPPGARPRTRGSSSTSSSRRV